MNKQIKKRSKIEKKYVLEITNKQSLLPCDAKYFVNVKLSPKYQIFKLWP